MQQSAIENQLNIVVIFRLISEILLKRAAISQNKSKAPRRFHMSQHLLDWIKPILLTTIDVAGAKQKKTYMAD